MENNIPAYEFRTSEYIKEGFRLFLNKPKTLLVYLLGVWIALGVCAIIPFFGQVIHVVIFCFSAAGFFLLIDDLKKSDRQDWTSLAKLGDLSAQLILGQLVYIILVTLGFVFLVLPGIYLTVGYLFFTLNITLKHQNFWDALENSRKVINANWFSAFGFVLLLVLINLVGMCTVIGALVTFPASACAVYLAFEDVMKQTHNNVEVITAPAST